MKKSFLFLVMLCVSVGFFSCEPKKSPGPVSTLTATVNGTTFTGSSVNALDAQGAFLITATSATGQEISISIPDLSSSKSSYTIDSLYHQAWYYTNTNTTPVTARTGTFTINFSGNNSGTGTFSYTCKDGTIVSNGVYTAYWN